MSNMPHAEICIKNVYVGVFFAYEQTKAARNVLPPDALDIILDEMCEVLKVPKDKILSRSRRIEHFMARHLFFYAARQLTTCSLKTIGDKVGRDHTTVVNGVSQVEKHLMTWDKRFMPIWNRYITKSILFTKK